MWDFFSRHPRIAFISSPLLLNEWNSNIYIQRDGICTGSCLAPILSDMFLSSRDRILKERFEGSGMGGIFRFVDYLAFLECDNLECEKQFLHLYSVFLECLKPMVFTRSSS